jgi:hypothetical protein
MFRPAFREAAYTRSAELAELLKETMMLVIAEGILLSAFVILSLAIPPAGGAA